MHKIQLLKLGIVAIAPVSLLMFTPHLRAEEKLDCQNPQSGYESSSCAQIKYEQADKQLNQVYQQKLRKLTGLKRKKLIKTQTQWIKYRDKTCDAQVKEYVGTTGYGQALGDCLTSLTIKRTKQLKNQP